MPEQESRQTIKLKPIVADNAPADEDLTVKVPRKEVVSPINPAKKTIQLKPMNKPSSPQESSGKQTIQLKPMNKPSAGNEDLTTKMPSPKPAGKQTIQLTPAGKDEDHTRAIGKQTIKLTPPGANKEDASPAAKTVQLKGPKASAKTVNLKAKKKNDTPTASDPTINLDTSDVLDDLNLDAPAPEIGKSAKSQGEDTLDKVFAALNLVAAGALAFILYTHFTNMF